jgi:transposase-like protein
MRKYDDEFKREAVKKIHDGQSVASVARELGEALEFAPQLEAASRRDKFRLGARSSRLA